MCDAKEFALATVDGGFYYSPTFKDDKFIHATADPQFLLEAGNHFYKVLKIVCDIRLLLGMDYYLECMCSRCTLARKLYFQLSRGSASSINCDELPVLHATLLILAMITVSN